MGNITEENNKPYLIFDSEKFLFLYKENLFASRIFYCSTNIIRKLEYLYFNKLGPKFTKTLSGKQQTNEN